MENVDLVSTPQWQPFTWLNLEHPFFTINTITILHTWIALLLLGILLLILRWSLRYPHGLLGFSTLAIIRSFMETVDEALASSHHPHIFFFFALFVFIALCNCLALLPFLTEPTQDINTTLALGTITFLYIQLHTISKHGLRAYIAEYFKPFFIMFPINLIGHLASILSLSFRLFGNIFGGATITHLFVNGIRSYLTPSLMGIIVLTLGTICGASLNLVFGLFEGLLQAFVFTMLSLTYLGIAVQDNEPTGVAANEYSS